MSFDRTVRQDPIFAALEAEVNHERHVQAMKHWYSYPVSGCRLEGLSSNSRAAAASRPCYFAQRLPALRWQPSDIEPRALASIAAHQATPTSPICCRRFSSMRPRSRGRSSAPMRSSAST